MDLKESVQLEYKCHDQSLKDQSSFRNTSRSELNANNLTNINNSNNNNNNNNNNSSSSSNLNSVFSSGSNNSHIAR